MSVPAPAVATWRAGQWKVTVTATGGRQWLYDVIGSTDRPSPGWFAGTPWAMYPGAGWREADGTAEPPEWTAPVFPVSAAAAQDLDVRWPPPQGDGKVAGELQAGPVRLPGYPRGAAVHERPRRPARLRRRETWAGLSRKEHWPPWLPHLLPGTSRPMHSPDGGSAQAPRPDQPNVAFRTYRASPGYP